MLSQIRKFVNNPLIIISSLKIPWTAIYLILCFAIYLFFWFSYVSYRKRQPPHYATFIFSILLFSMFAFIIYAFLRAAFSLVRYRALKKYRFRQTELLRIIDELKSKAEPMVWEAIKQLEEQNSNLNGRLDIIEKNLHPFRLTIYCIFLAIALLIIAPYIQKYLIK